MTTPEQQAREMLQRATSFDLTELANLIAERDVLKAEFKIIDEMNDQLREQNEAVGDACAKMEAELEVMRASKDAAYTERNQVVAALSKCFPAGTARTAIEGWSDDWHGCVYIDLPTGQVSWHFHDSQAHLFAHLPPYTGSWDGHDTTEKYRRLAELAAIKQGTVEPVAWGQLGTMNGKTYLRGNWDRRPYPPPLSLIKSLALVPLYTRPCVPLTDERVKELILEHFLTGENQFNEVHQDYRFRSPATERNVWGRDLLAFARAIEAAHNIKGAKG